MKKVRLLTIALTLLMVFSVGCSKKEAEPAAEETEVTEEAEQAEEAEASEEATQETESEEVKEGESSQVAGKEDMAEVEDVVEDWMVPIEGANIKDGNYGIEVASSSSMFKIDSCELQVANGEMNAVMTMGGTGYLYLFPGTGEEAAAADESQYIAFEENADGQHVFTVPVDALDKGIDFAAFSKRKEMWYDRTLVFRSDSLPAEAYVDGFNVTTTSLALEDGEYQVDIELKGGSGKATIESPTKLVVSGGESVVTITWSSSNYDYMVVDGEKYLPINTEGNSVFEIPVSTFDRFVPVTADTTAMSTPHEIEYRVKMDSTSVK